MLQSKQRPKRKLQDHQKARLREAKGSKVDCLICLEPILKADNYCMGEEVVFCEEMATHKMCGNYLSRL